MKFFITISIEMMIYSTSEGGIEPQKIEPKLKKIKDKNVTPFKMAM